MKLFTHTLASTSFVLLISVTTCFGAATEEMKRGDRRIIQLCPVDRTIINGNLEEAKEALAQRPAQVNDPYTKGLTLLHMAALQNNQEMVELLLNTGAKIDAQDDDGNTALFSAFYKKDDEGLVQFLVDRKANILIKDNHGFTALELARRQGKVRVMRVLETAMVNQGLNSWYEQVKVRSARTKSF
ncbi:ankyrin repeat domain-containing protein [Candidatus Babeliales bacterium]|nr:ankyrin repeat domain-containing protein [Candidatus Babeliales bacterium]